MAFVLDFMIAKFDLVGQLTTGLLCSQIRKAFDPSYRTKAQFPLLFFSWRMAGE